MAASTSAISLTPPMVAGDRPTGFRARLTLGEPAADTQPGMSDTFAFRTIPTPLHRRVSPRAVKAATAGLVALFIVSWFARWVSQSERVSFAAAAQHAASGNLVDTLAGAPEQVPTGGAVPVSADDRLAQRAARESLAAARRIATGPTSFVEAGPAQLAEALPAYTFADGPSAVPQVVSVASTGEAWGAAVMSGGGRCFYVRASSHGRVDYGTSSTDCTGVGALGATSSSW